MLSDSLSLLVTMSNKMKTKLFNYFVYAGLLVHLLLLIVFLWQPQLLSKLAAIPVNYYYNKSAERELNKYVDVLAKPIEQQIAEVFKVWSPLNNHSNKSQVIAINGVYFDTLAEALAVLKSGDELQFYHGTFNTPFLINKNDITIVGYGHVVFEKAAYRGKGFVVSKGVNLTIKNIECRFISASDRNGACVRQEGQGLALEHVYFHHSENGVLENSKQPGNIYISDSRFELLGKNGRAHGIYSNTANLYIENSLFIASKDESHAIKNRAKETYINHSIITSMSSNDSRLIDISNGGVLTIENSLLHQGPFSVNGQVIGFGLESLKHKTNNVTIKGSVIIAERIKKNVLLATGENSVNITMNNNVIVNQSVNKEYSGNQYFSSREEAGLPNFPKFPQITRQWLTPCPLKASP